MLECSCSKCGEALRVYEEDHPQWGKSYQVDPCKTCTVVVNYYLAGEEDLKEFNRVSMQIPVTEDLIEDAKAMGLIR